MFFRFALLVTMVSFAAGCSSGLSPRETRTQNYSSFIMSLYDNPRTSSAAPARVVAPMRMAVAQVGELAPPQAMLEELRKNPGLFARVEGIPGVFEQVHYRQNDGPLSDAEKLEVRDRVATLQRLTRDMGMDYLFIYGGSIDQYTRENPLQVLDLTIVGAFVVPSREVRAVGKAAGALIEARSGAVVFVASADTEKSKLASATNKDGEEMKVMENTRESLTLRLADQLVERCREVALTGVQ